MPIHGVSPKLISNSVTVYAPSPKNEACPKDTRPEYPERMFHDRPMVAHTGTSVIMS